MQSQTQREDDVKTHRDNTMWREGELQLAVSMRALHARGRVGPQDAGLGAEQSSLDPSEQATPCQHLDFRLRLQNWGTISFCCLGHAVLGLLFQHPYKTNRPSKSTLKPFLMFHVGSKMTDFRRKRGARVGTHKLLGQSFETSRAVCTPIRQLCLWHSLPFDLKPRQDGVPEFTCPAISCPILLRLVQPRLRDSSSMNYLGLFSEVQQLPSPILPLSHWEVLRGSSHSVCI